MPDAALGPGDVIAGKYRIETRLGTGGMGYVLGAVHLGHGERVAIKVLHPDSATDQENVQRFLREARSVAKIKGEHVVRLLDVGTLEDQTPYIVMEYLEGQDLGALIDVQGRLPVQTAIDYVLQACEALAEAHAIGIVHRDVKPSNLFLANQIDGTRCVKMLDFGISKAMHAVDATQPDFGLTQTQTVLGSPQYMAPEQMRSAKNVDPRTDIWAIGTIIHELLTGEAPFVASSMPELFAMILTDPTPSLCAKRPDVPAELDRVVARCLEKRPENRYPSMDALAADLAPFASSGARESVQRIARVAYNAALRATPSSQVERASASAAFAAAQTIADAKKKPSAGKLVAAGVFALLFVGGGVAAAIALRSREPRPTVVVGAPSASVPSAPPPPSPEPVPSFVLAPTPSASAAVASAPSAQSRVVGRGTARTAPPVAPSASAVRVPAAATTPAPTTAPATTASSRYD